MNSDPIDHIVQILSEPFNGKEPQYLIDKKDQIMTKIILKIENQVL